VPPDGFVAVVVVVSPVGFESAVPLSEPPDDTVESPEPEEVVEEPLLVGTGFGLATGAGSVTRLFAPALEVETPVGAVASEVPTVYAVVGRRTPEVLGANGLGADGVVDAEPFASRPAATSPASGATGRFGSETMGGAFTTG
jgi:hypothetical protein